MFFVVSAIGVYTHYYFVLYTAFQGLCMLAKRQWKTALLLGLAFAAIGAPLAWYLSSQQDLQAQRWMLGARDVWELTVTAGLAFSDFVLLVPPAWLPLWLPGPLVPAAKMFYVLLLGGLLLAAARTTLPAWLGEKDEQNPAKRQWTLTFLLGWLLFPALLLIFLNVLRHTGTFVHTRYLFGAAPALYIVLGMGAARLRKGAQASCAVLLAVMIAANYAGMARLAVGELIEGADFQRVAQVITAAWKPGNVIVIHSSYAQTPIALGYYLPPETPVMSLVYNTRNAQGVLTSRPDQRDIPARMDRHLSATPRLWVIRAFTDVTYGDLDGWLRAHYVTVRAQRYGAMVLREMQRR